MCDVGLLLAPHFGTAIQRLTLIWLVLAAASLVIIVLRWLTLPDDGGLGILATGNGFEAGAGFGLIIGLIAAAVSTAAAVVSFRSAPSASAA